MRWLVPILNCECRLNIIIHTNGAPFRVLFSDTFYCVQVHVNLLTGPEFCENNILCRCWMGPTIWEGIRRIPYL